MVGLQKPRPKLLDKHAAKLAVLNEDRAENAKVRQRSTGQCEVKMARQVDNGHVRAERRCHLRASQVHHLMGGIGRRNKGLSIKADHKLHVCDRCHEEIHGHVLKPVNAYMRELAATVRYERVK